MSLHSYEFLGHAYRKFAGTSDVFRPELVFVLIAGAKRTEAYGQNVQLLNQEEQLQCSVKPFCLRLALLQVEV
ncbi:Uncharacterised protein [Acinetobacter baumannii]|nr:Uncharacterised protein [Acinetobacter baumannii]